MLIASRRICSSEGATENKLVAQALIDNLISRGLDPDVPRLFIVDGAEVLSRATVRQTSRNVKLWRNAEMAPRWTAAGLFEAQKGFRRLKA